MDKCPRCESTNIWKLGKQYQATGMYQRWQCKNCGHSFKGELLKSFTLEAKFREMTKTS